MPPRAVLVRLRMTRSASTQDAGGFDYDCNLRACFVSFWFSDEFKKGVTR